MNAYDLVLELRSKGYSIIADGSYLDISPAENLPPELVQQLKQSKAEVLAVLRLEQQQESRRQKAIAMLGANPDMRRAIYTDTESDPHNVIMVIAVRHVATFEMLIDKVKYAPWRLLEVVDQ